MIENKEITRIFEGNSWKHDGYLVQMDIVNKSCRFYRRECRSLFLAENPMAAEKELMCSNQHLKHFLTNIKFVIC